MSHNKTIGLLIIIGLFSLPAWCIGDEEDGNKLLSNCGAAISLLDGQSVDQSKAGGIGFCFGLMQGVLHTNQIYEYRLKDAALFCQPNGVNNGQAGRMSLSICANILKSYTCGAVF